MGFFSPWNLLLLCFIPVVILMYILKQKFEEREVSSIYLWEQVLKDIEVNTPWQKLKKNILMFLQILSVLLLVLSLAKPYIFINGSRSRNLIMVIDNSGSMSAKSGNFTRLESAKRQAESFVNSLSPSGKVTVITCGKHPTVVLTTDDRYQAAEVIRSIKPSYAGGDINEVATLIKALLKQDNKARSVVYTDRPLDMKDINSELVSLSDPCENVSLDYISHSKNNDDLKVLIRAANRGENKLSREISLYGDGKLLDLQRIELEGRKTETVYFNNIPSDLRYLYAEISEKDDLVEDNIIYSVVSQSQNKKALLVTQKNVFVEKTLANLKGIDLYKGNSADGITGEYDLYIFDGIMPEKVPDSGSIMLINPPKANEIANVGGIIEGGAVRFNKHPVTKYMERAYFTVASMKQIIVPIWADVLASAGEKPVILAGELKGRRVCIINFDMHNSDFPLIAEFPVFMYNAFGYLVNTGFEGKTSYYCGEEVEVSPMPDAEEAFVKLPSGYTEKIGLKYPVLPFENTYEMGIYRLLQKSGDMESNSIFAVNFPSEYESDINVEAGSISGSDSREETGYGKNVQLHILVFFLLIVTVEWVVYTRGY